MLNTVGIFDPAVLSEPERAVYAGRRDYFWFGEVVSAAALAGAFTIPIGIYLAGKSGSMLSFTTAAMIFLLLFIFLPRLIRLAMKTDGETVLDLFGKNEHFRKVFWTVFIVLAGLVLAQVVDPATAQEILRVLAGMGG
jgi:Na+/proline symporter